MAQWGRSDKMLYAKVVYYGPAFGGKTTNLESLHRLTDPEGRNKLLTIQTSDDRTLFFDLLPFDLGAILGHQVALKLYAVPGQVRYDATRQVVLSGADAVIFVADSSRGREEQNRWSLQNLRMNMRAKRLDPGRVPVIFQFNKQDVPDAAPPEEVARLLGVPANEGIPSVATEGQGVLETFMLGCRTMLEALAAQADERTRREIDVAALGEHLERALSPHLARRGETPDHAESAVVGAESATRSIVAPTEDLLQSSVLTSTELGEQLATETARAFRLEREAEAYRRLGESLRHVGASFDRGAIIDSALLAVTEILGAPAVSLVQLPAAEQPVAERVMGRARDPLIGTPAGRRLILHLLETGRPCVVDDLHAECADAEATDCMQGLRAGVSVPLATEPPSALIVYAAHPDGEFDGDDVRFLDTVAGHLTTGLEKVQLHGELSHHRDQLEDAVASRTEQLRQAYEELRGQEKMKDRLLANLSHEMKTPLTAILSSAVFLRDYKSDDKQRGEMVQSIVHSAEVLQSRLDDLLRLVSLEGEPPPLRYSRSTAEQLARESLQLAGGPDVKVKLGEAPASLKIDVDRLARAVANLVDNARKFSPPEKPVELKLSGITLRRDEEKLEGLAIRVLDRGPGVAAEDRERIFSLFEQGGDPMTSKPSGIGIGLHEARTIVRQHGGRLTCAARKGGGSEFRIEIPARPRAKEALEEAVRA